MPVVLIILFALLVLVISCIRIVPQTESYVIERLGKFKKIWDAGVHFLLTYANIRKSMEKQFNNPPLDD